MKKDIHNKLIEFGSIHLKDWHVIEIIGDELKVEEFLQGQVTSDISLLSEKCSQLSSVCNHKGLVIADFIITKNNKTINLKGINLQFFHSFGQFSVGSFHN